MAAVFETPEVPTVGTTPQTVVSCSTGQQVQLLACTATNRDSVTRTMILKKVGGTITPFEVSRVTIEPGERKSMMVAPCEGLDGNGESFTIESDATAATTEPFVHAVAFKVSA